MANSNGDKNKNNSAEIGLNKKSGLRRIFCAAIWMREYKHVVWADFPQIHLG